MSDLSELRQLLLDKREELLNRVKALEKDIRHTDGPLNADFAEQAVELENSEVLDALDDEARLTLHMIDKSLKRMDAGEYEICTECGETIPEQRLKALPYTDLCVSCAELREH